MDKLFAVIMTGITLIGSNHPQNIIAYGSLIGLIFIIFCFLITRLPGRVERTDLGCRKSPYDKRDLLVSSFLFDLTELPISLNYRDKMPPVRNQGKEGSCTGHAADYLKQYQEKIDYNRLIVLSPRFIYEEAKKISGGSEGSTMKAVSEALIKKGICEENFWPYIAGNIGNPKDGTYDNALKYKESPIYTRITNEKELKGSLVKFGPIIAGVLVYKNWYRQKNGRIPDSTFWEGLYGALGGHAICICGYDDDMGEYMFINSWGEEWGDKGYGYITYKHMKKILMDAFALIDIDDPKPYKKTVADLSFWQRRTRWV